MKKLILLVAFLFVLVSCFSQKLQYTTSYGINEGVSKGLIKTILTDDIGYFWAGTDEGLIRFDGNNAILYRDLLPFPAFCKDLINGNDGSFYALYDYGLSRVISEADTTYSIPLITGSQIDTDSTLHFPKTMYQDKNGDLWIGENSSIVWYRKGDIKKFRFSARDASNSFNIGESFSFGETSNGTLWAISLTGNLFFFDESKESFVPIVSLPVSSVFSMVVDGNDNLVLGSEEGLSMVLMSNDAPPEYQLIKSIPNVVRIVQGREDVLYISTQNGHVFAAKSNELLSSIEQILPLPFNRIIDSYYDHRGALWICNEEQVGLLNPVYFESMPFDSDIKYVSTINMSYDKNPIALVNRYVYEIDTDLKVSFPILQQFEPWLPASVYKGQFDFWIGDWDGNVYTIDENNEILNPIDANIGAKVLALFEDQKGNVWATGDAVMRISKEQKPKVYSDITSSITLHELNTGLILLLTNDPAKYLYLYHPDVDTFYNISLPIPVDLATDIVFEDIAVKNSHEIYLATSIGLFKIHGHQSERQIERVDLENVPVNDHIYAVESVGDKLWVATSHGLLLHKEDGNLLFDTKSGLPTTNIIPRGLMVDTEKRLWVATSIGLSYLSYEGDRSTPTPVLTSVSIDGETNNEDLGNEFPYRTLVEIDFSALAFPSEDINYEYRVIGLDTNWHAANGHSFTRLFKKTGEYTFQVRAQQTGGMLWSEPASYQFYIGTPWFYTAWGIAIIVVSFSLVLIVSVRLYNWNLLKANKRLEYLVKERTREIEKHKNQIIEHQEELLQRNQEVYEKQLTLDQLIIEKNELERQKLEQDLENKNKHLTTVSLKIVQKNETLKELKEEIEKVASNANGHANELRKLSKMIDLSFQLEKDWEEFIMCFEDVHLGFNENLKQQFPALTVHDLRHCALIRLNLTIREAGNLLGISPESVKIFRFRLKKKMELSSQQELTELIMKI